MDRIRIYIAGLLTAATLIVAAGCKVDHQFDLEKLDTEYESPMYSVPRTG